MAAPRSTAGIAHKFTGARGVFVLNGHRRANRAGSRDVASEPHQIRMRYNSVGDVDREIVGRIARAPLRHKEKFSRTIVYRASLRRGSQHEATCGRQVKQNLYLHRNSSEASS